ncbi:hypothetical protein [uncultured Tateyamaria sp.]|uniref:hypothetical protein n=1 Tax=uncultured Tateyamaria sp. TaxID=455651 RepID=UPI0026213D8C|nr:hypothetical protein [uncultured Tateyamaria sp.]
MNFETSARVSADQAMDAWKVLESLYQGGITNGDDMFVKVASFLKSVGEEGKANSERAKSEIVYQELKDVEQAAQGNPLIWPLLVQARAEAKRAVILADAASVYASQSKESDEPALYDPHPWAYLAEMSAVLCRDCLDQALEVLRDGKA